LTDETTEDPTILFYFDYVSPNAYIAWTQIHPLAARFGRRVAPVPVLFAGLLRAHDLLGPAEVRPKWRWMVRDIVRKAKRLGIPLRPPTSHPFNPLLALRVTSLPMDDAARIRLTDGLFRAVWAGGPGATDPDRIAAVADEAGLDGGAAVERAGMPDIKDRLRSQTDAAILQGVFGVPTIVCDGQLFWGYDDLPHLEELLSGTLSYESAEFDPWERIPRGATRRRH
jgi:2-hydroxychromene-2-carboxylate isomerase